MPKYERDSKITILKKEKNVDEILKTLINYPADQVVAFFQNIGLSFPREIRIAVLRGVLRGPVLKVRNERASLADEINYRLGWFNQFSEIQLVNLFSLFKDAELEKLYFEELWLSLLEYATDKRISENDFDRLIMDSVNHAKKDGIKAADAVSYNTVLDPLFFDKKDQIDGLTQDVIRPVLYKSSTITEIRELGLKYGVNVPKRLKKNELIDIVVKELKERNEHTPELEEKIKGMNILLIQRFAINNKIKASTELKKEEVIEYILLNANETKETYFVPSPTVYEVEANQLGESMPELDTVVEDTNDETTLEDTLEDAEVALEEAVENLEETELAPGKPVVVTERVVQVAAPREGIDVSTIEETYLNVVEYHGTKPKKYIRQLQEDYNVDEDDEVETKEKVYQVEFLGLDKKKRSFGRFIGKLLIFLLALVLILALILVIYSALTPNGGVAAIDNFLNKLFNFNGLTKLRDLIQKLLGK
ncbi:MAG: hypothetical protein RBQ97_03100 [Acholeplasma sp.]|nr:hypothetical protein [Acholeplasma sp.]